VRGEVQCSDAGRQTHLWHAGRENTHEEGHGCADVAAGQRESRRAAALEKGTGRALLRCHRRRQDRDKYVFPLQGEEQLEQAEHTGREAAGRCGGDDYATLHEQALGRG
jgi:hypothetical protein